MGNIYTLGALARFPRPVSGTNILSTPNLVALDNEEAKIVVGSNVPFVTGSSPTPGDQQRHRSIRSRPSSARTWD